MDELTKPLKSAFSSLSVPCCMTSLSAQTFVQVTGDAFLDVTQNVKPMPMPMPLFRSLTDVFIQLCMKF